MRGFQNKLAWIALSAIPFALADLNLGQCLLFGALSVVIYLITGLAAGVFKRYLTPVFQTLFSVVFIATFVEGTAVFLGCSGGAAALIIFSIYLLHLSIVKFSERIETGLIFLIFVLLPVVFRSTWPEAMGNFFPAVLIITAFGMVAVSFIFNIAKANKR